EFIKAAALAGVSLSALGCMKSPQEKVLSTPVATTVAPASPAFDLTVAQGTDPVSLLERGFKALGGINQYVKKDGSVVIKPNFSVPRTPEEAATTNTIMVATLVKMCLTAGAREVKVVDQPLNSQSPVLCLERTGIKKAVENAGGKVFTYNGVRDAFRPVSFAGKTLTNFEYAKDVLDADLFINFPILKHHGGAKLTLGMKNLMGLIWDRRYFHSSDLHQAIAELAAFRKPHLTIMDAIRGITDKGPIGPGPIREYGQVIFGTDQVAIDAYATSLFGMKPQDIGYIRIASEMGIGQIQWEKLRIQKV
ncbi:MAG TPA: DUF362 domain-containing protein, partial [Negativicutes bacterium]|nr:DUF362 domain-containing protein [Negativicutes bacterium]